MSTAALYCQDEEGTVHRGHITTTDDDAHTVMIYPSDCYELVGNTLVPMEGMTMLTEAAGAALFQEQQDAFTQTISDSHLT